MFFSKVIITIQSFTLFSGSFMMHHLYDCAHGRLNVLQMKNVVHTFGKLNNQYVTSCGLMLS